MSKLNNRLFSIFLTLGIIFFLVTIYMFVTNEILPKTTNSTKHTLTVSSIKFVKNDFVDTATVNRQKHTNERMVFDENDREQYEFSLINLVDNASYVKSRVFNLKTIVSPEIVEFYNSSIPQPTLNDNYQLGLSHKGEKVSEFKEINFNSLLDIKNKKDNSTEKREIKMTSTDNKVIIFMTLTID